MTMDRRGRLQATAPTITWRPVNVPDLLEARLVVGDGNDGGLYAGYVARTPGDGNDAWRGYIGLMHLPVGIGRRPAVQAAVERAARAAWAARMAGARDHGQRDTASRSDE